MHLSPFPYLLPLLVAGGLLSGCGSGEAAAPAGLRSTDLRDWTDLSSMLEPDFVERAFDERQAQLVRPVWLEGPARLLIEARGSGTVVITARRDNEAPRELERFELSDARYTTRVIELPGSGARELELTLDGGPDVTWGEVTLLEALGRPADPPSSGPALLARRNVILIVADSLHATHLGSYGYERATSPGLDRLASSGVRFARAYSQTSWTLSSISSLFTSHEQERHSVLELNQRLDDRFETLAELFQARDYRTLGLIQNGILWKETGLGQGFDEYTTFPYDADGLASMVQRARDAVQEESPRPLFLYIHFTPPHQPYQPPASYIESFVDPDYAGEVDGSIRSCGLINHNKPPADSADVRHLRDLYDAHIRFVDDQIDSLLATARERAQLEDTLVIFTSDHGEAFMQHGAQGHNAHVYEEMVNVPLIVAAPGSALAQGQVIETPASLLDVMPTLIELFGLEAPGTRLDGTSLVPYLKPDAPQPRERTLFYSSRYKDELDRVQFAVRSGGHKLVVKRGKAALFDLSQDPGEQSDVSGLYPIRTRALWCRLGAWWRAARAEGTRSLSTAPTAEVLEQLQGLGYVDTDEDG